MLASALRCQRQPSAKQRTTSLNKIARETIRKMGSIMSLQEQLETLEAMDDRVHEIEMTLQRTMVYNRVLQENIEHLSDLVQAHSDALEKMQKQQGFDVK